jgi:hypothetical protein
MTDMIETNPATVPIHSIRRRASRELSNHVERLFRSAPDHSRAAAGAARYLFVEGKACLRREEQVCDAGEDRNSCKLQFLRTDQVLVTTERGLK